MTCHCLRDVLVSAHRTQMEMMKRVSIICGGARIRSATLSGIQRTVHMMGCATVVSVCSTLYKWGKDGCEMMADEPTGGGESGLSSVVPDDAPAALVPKPKNRRDPDWGLEPCRPDFHCIVCEAMQEMSPSELRIMRNFYVEGTPVRIIAFSYDMPARQIWAHAKRAGWDKKKRKDPRDDRQKILRNIAMSRYIQFQHLGAPNTSDKMVELLFKAEGMAGGGKVEVETEVAGRWEDRLMGLKQKTTVRMADTPVVTDADYAQYPGEEED